MPEALVYQILHRPASHARVLLNGVPLYDREPDCNVSPQGPVSNWLVPGTNTVSIEMAPRPPDPRAPLMGPHFAMMILPAAASAKGPEQGSDGSELAAVSLFRWEFPRSILAESQIPALPWTHTATFAMPLDHPEPVYLRASREDFPIEGTAGQRAAVAELYDAFATADAGRFANAMDLKFSEFERYFGPQPKARSSAVSRLGGGWVMEPFDPQDLRFERYVDGKVAHVRRASGKPAVRATNRDAPFLGWGADLFLTRLDGVWRVFR